jgi:predicted nucleotidyltransferase
VERRSLAMVNSREEVLRLIEKNRETLRKLGVRRIGLFGSCARGEASAESDLDFVVEFSNKSFDAYMDLKSFLEDLFRSRVDLVTVSSIKPRLLPIIQREAVYASGF